MEIHSWLKILIMVNNANICRMPAPECVPEIRRQRFFPLQKLNVPPVPSLPWPPKTGLKNLLNFKKDDRSQVSRQAFRRDKGFMVRTYSGGVVSRVTILAE